MPWNAASYLSYADLRTRPAYELAARIGVEAPRTVYDLGCGPGNSTRVLAERWPNARLIGVDSSAEMLAAARQEGPKGADWRLADITSWRPDEAPQVIFSNATMQWIPGQKELLPRLMAMLERGGVLAFQIPANHTDPPHTTIDAALGELGLAERIQSAALSRHVLQQVDYYHLLAPVSAPIDIWDTVYLQVLSGSDAVLNWVKGTALVPVMGALSLQEQNAFIEHLAARLRAEYPLDATGKTLFPFRRRFVVAKRA